MIVMPAWLLGLLALPTAGADPDEAWLHRAELPAGVHPLLVLVMDTSEAAARTILAAPAYEPLQDYAASVPAALRCDPGRVYWRRGPGPAADCRTQAGLDAAGGATPRAFECAAARAALSRQGFFVASRAAQWRGGADRRWADLDADAVGAVECRADRARHGNSPGTWYAADGLRGPWSDAAADEIRWDRAPLADPYVFYLGNYLNYLRATLAPREIAISDLARRSLADALRATDGIDAALLRFAAGADGGYVARAAAPASAVATDLEAMGGDAPESGAPLAEALAEAAAWLAGGPVRFGGDAAADARAFDATSGRYASPFVHACRPVTIAFATAGLASDDESAPDAAADLPGFTAATGGCSTDCLGHVARFIAGSDLRSELAARQSAPLHWLAPAPAPSALAAAADSSPISRVDDPHAYIELVVRSHQHDAAIPAGPALSSAGLAVASSVTHEAAVTYALSAPRTRQRWLGNLFRYHLRGPQSPHLPPTIVDRDGEPAIDARSGLPLPASRSIWSEAPDADLLAGGAAGRLPAAPERRVYTTLVSPDISDAGNRVVPGHPSLDRMTIGLGAADPETPADVIAALLEARPFGDPGLRPPTVVDYPNEDLAIVFASTHDGLLHAVDAASGVERWAWMPREMLPHLTGLVRDEATTARRHGIDGPIVVHRFDPDGDGFIDAARGEHLWLLVGLGRGRSVTYALDIADPDRPQLLWTHSATGNPGVNSSPGPIVARLSTGDPAQSSQGWIVMLADGQGLQLLDAGSGRVLWSASAGDEATLPLRELSGTFASAPRALDLDGDGLIDRAYLVDSAGGLWRFDFVRGASPATLASARRIAALGDGSQHFQASPDVSLARLPGRSEIALAVGSGRLDRPRDATAVDRVYVIFDRGQAEELEDQDLHDATDRESAMPPTAPGWFLRLDRHGRGEKVAGPGLTFDHVLRFQTYQPLPQEADAPCGPPRAVHRRYARDIRTGLPDTNVERPDDGEEMEIEATGLPVELRYAFPPRADDSCAGCRARPFGIAGPQIFDPGYAGDPVRTSWRKLPLPASR